VYQASSAGADFGRRGSSSIHTAEAHRLRASTRTTEHQSCPSNRAIDASSGLVCLLLLAPCLTTIRCRSPRFNWRCAKFATHTSHSHHLISLPAFHPIQVKQHSAESVSSRVVPPLWDCCRRLFWRCSSSDPQLSEQCQSVLCLPACLPACLPTARSHLSWGAPCIIVCRPNSGLTKNLPVYIYPSPGHDAGRRWTRRGRGFGCYVRE